MVTLPYVLPLRVHDVRQPRGTTSHRGVSACVSMCQPVSACVSMCQPVSACVSLYQPQQNLDLLTGQSLLDEDWMSEDGRPIRRPIGSPNKEVNWSEGVQNDQMSQN